MITGNKGEWSEIYVLFRLLSENRLYCADENLNKSKVYFPIIKIIREEQKGSKFEYFSGKKIKIFENGLLKFSLDSEEFTHQADSLFCDILKGKNSFSIPKTEYFMNHIFCFKLKSPSSDKSDIKIQIYDIKTGYSPICGFSIKSELGNKPTLINPSAATNFTYKIENINKYKKNEINSIYTKNKIIDRMEHINRNDISFHSLKNKTFKDNLLLIDSQMPEIIGNILLRHYQTNIKSCRELIDLIENEDPLKIKRKNFYFFKFKKLLCAAALGLLPSKPWNGKDDANGGYIIVKSDGNVVAFHIYNRDAFEDYLLNNTVFEKPSTSRYKYAEIYEENSAFFINLNLQIRFK